MSQTPEDALAHLKDLDRQLTAHDAGDKKAVETALKAMKKAMDDESEDEIQLARPLVDDAVDTVDRSLHACQQMHADVDTLQQHRDFLAAHRDELVRIVQHFGSKQKELAQWAKTLRQLSEDAGKAEGAAKKGSGEVEAELAEIKNWARKLDTRLGDYRSAAPKIEKTARAEPTSKDAEKARLQLIDLQSELQAVLRQLSPKIAAFRKNHPDLERGQKNELQAAVDTAQQGDDAAKESNALLLALLKLKQQTAADDAQRPKGIELSEAEVRKSVAPIVGVDPKDARAIGELADLLHETPHEKWGDALGRFAGKFKLKNGNGKALAQAIDKLPAIRKQAAPAR